MRTPLWGVLLALLLGCPAPTEDQEPGGQPPEQDEGWAPDAGPCPDHVQERCLAPPDDDDVEPVDDDDLEDCPPLGPGVDPDIGVEAGWQVELYAQGLGEVSAVDVDAGGDLLLGQGLGGWEAMPVLRVTPGGDVTSSSAISDPDGVAVDDDGLVWAAGADQVWHLHSLSPGGGPDEAWLSTGGNLNDLVLDGDLLYVARDGGDVLRYEPDGASASWEIGASPAIDLGDDGELWILARSDGQLYRLDGETLVPEAAFADLDPSYLTSNRVAWNPDDGTLHAASFFQGLGGQIVRWDPAAPGEFTGWITGLIDEHNPDGLEWDGGCLYWTAPLSGRVYRVCPCP